jgi:hypothetical protein
MFKARKELVGRVFLVAIALLAGLGAWCFYFREKPNEPKSAVGELGPQADESSDDRQQQRRLVVEIGNLTRSHAGFYPNYGAVEFRNELRRLLESRRVAEEINGVSLPQIPDTMDDGWLVHQPVIRALLLERISREQSGREHFRMLNLADLFLRAHGADVRIDGGDGNEFTETCARTFGAVFLQGQEDQIDMAPFARRRLQERLADIRRIAATSERLRTLGIDATSYPLLARAVNRLGTNATALRDADRQYVMGMTEFVTVQDCTVARLVESNWNAFFGNGNTGLGGINIVGGLTAEQLHAARKTRSQIADEGARASRMAGVTADQQIQINAVYGELLRFLDNEFVRQQRIQRRDWRREAVSLVPASGQTVVISISDPPCRSNVRYIEASSQDRKPKMAAVCPSYREGFENVAQIPDRNEGNFC